MPLVRRKKPLTLKAFEKAYFEHFEKYGYPPSVKQLSQKFKVTPDTVSQKFRKLIEEGKVDTRLGKVRTKEMVRLSADEYAAFVFAQRYYQDTGKKVDPRLLVEVFSDKKFERVFTRLKKKLGTQEFKKWFTTGHGVGKTKKELEEYILYLDKMRREEIEH